MLHYFYAVCSILFISQIYAPQFFDNLVAHVVPCYCLTVVCIFVAFYRSTRNPSAKAPLEYKLKKASKTSAIPTEVSWKHQFIGTWDKIERPGFKEFAMFVGKSSFVASYAEKQPFGNVIMFKDDSEKEMKIDGTGTPAQPGVWCVIGGGEVECKDPNGNPILDKIWWDEPNKILCRSLCSPPGDSGNDMQQTRQIMSDGTMVSNAKLTRRKDGKFCEYKVIFKRK